MLSLLLMGFYLSSATCSELLSRQRRTWIIDSFTIEEENPGPFPYVLGKIDIDRSYRVFFDLYGEGVDEVPKGVLSIHKESGTIYVYKSVDYEEKTMLKLKFEVRKTDLSSDTKLGVEIHIQDINDNPPTFQKDLYEIRMNEEDIQGSHLLTVLANDIDQRGSPNSTFHYEIKSVSPNAPDTEFFITSSGAISFKGCLDHQVADMFTILVEAIDHGDVVSLSSSTTVLIHVRDSNNHLPAITGQTGSGTVREGETGSSPLRLHVTDKDTPHSPAWKAMFTIHGDEGGHFLIETDPRSNDGILTVVKPLDFEEGAQRELTITVENQLPYFFCQVMEKPSSGLWTVDTVKENGPGGGQPHSVRVTINLEDVNDAPVFSVSVKEAALEENAPVGTWVEKVTATDPDSSHASDFVYKIGDDRAGWVTVDPSTGDITTIKIPDRESPHVVNGVYSVLLHAVDNGDPPMTGTATLLIHVSDQNDNVPQPLVNYLDVCLSDMSTTTNITAFDLDGIPFGGPFTFQLLGDFQGKWKLNPSHGYAAGLVKEPNLYAGPHTIDLKISDLQGKFGIYNLSVIVCDCTVTTNCRTIRDSATRATPGAIGIGFLSLFLFLLVLLMVFVCSCKKEFIDFDSKSAEQTLLESYTETPGSDCKVPVRKYPPILHDEMQYLQSSPEQSLQGGCSMDGDNGSDFQQTTWSFTTKDYHNTHEFEDMTEMNFCSPSDSSSHVMNERLHTLLHQRLATLQETEDGLLDYELHSYADEGASDGLTELETITLSDDHSFQNALDELGPKFKLLASICQPVHTRH